MIEETKTTREEVEERTRTIIAEHFSLEAEELSNETVFIKDLNADSLDMVELVMEIEDEFNISIPDAEAEEIQTVGAAVKYVCLKLDIK